MIHSVTVTNPKNESLVLELRRPENSGLYIQNIEGLGPAKAQINSIGLATIDGSLHASAKIVERNIVITLGMMESPTIEDARLRTYKYFPVKKQIQLRIKTDNRDAIATGIVESNEPIIFSDRESAQISIICHDPHFYEIGDEITAFSGIQPKFEFPFSNESLTEDLIEFGEIRFDKRAVLTYIGDVDTGIEITIHILGPANNITIYNTDTHESLAIYTDRIKTLTNREVATGDDIIISTIRGQRYARLLREGLYTNIISAIDKKADWFQLSSGDNVFTFVAEKGENDLFIQFKYKNAYGGI